MRLYCMFGEQIEVQTNWIKVSKKREILEENVGKTKNANYESLLCHMSC